MSTSDNKTLHRLTVKVAAELSGVTQITVFDADNNVMPVEELEKRGFDPVPSKEVEKAYEFSLIRGLYTVRVDVNREIADTVIRLTGDACYYAGEDNTGQACTGRLNLPALYSAALIRFQGDYKRYTSTHEYYTHPAVQYSSQETVKQEGPKPDSCLFIFMRFASLEHFRKWIGQHKESAFWDKYRLTDDKGRVLYHFKPVKIMKDHDVVWDPEGSEIVADTYLGYWTFNAFLSPGMYFLMYEGVPGRQMPLYIYDRWHTQLFMTLNDDGTPAFGSARLFLAQQRNFDPLNTDSKYIDVFLDKLQNRDYSLSRELIEYAARSKFQSPMLGLLCAYIYLSGKDDSFDGMLEMMTYNLRHEILRGADDSPDLLALRILQDIHWNIEGDYSQLPPVKGTPMFRLGYDAIRKAAIKFPHLIPQYSLNDYIAEHVYCDSPYNTFGIVTAVDAYDRGASPEVTVITSNEYMNLDIPFEKIELEGLDDIEGLKVNKIRDLLGDEDDMKSSLPGDTSFEPPFFRPRGKFPREGASLPLQQGSRTWATEAIKNFMAGKTNINAAEIATQFKLPLNTVKRVISELGQQRPSIGFNFGQAPGRESDLNREAGV